MNEVICSCSFQVYLLPVQKHFHHFSFDVEVEHSDLVCILFIFSFSLPLFLFSHSYLFIFFPPYYYFAIHRDFDSHRQEFTHTHTHIKERWKKWGRKNNRQSTNGISLKRYMTMNNFIIYIAFNVAKNGTNENFWHRTGNNNHKKAFQHFFFCVGQYLLCSRRT